MSEAQAVSIGLQKVSEESDRVLCDIGEIYYSQCSSHHIPVAMTPGHRDKTAFLRKLVDSGFNPNSFVQSHWEDFNSEPVYDNLTEANVAHVYVRRQFGDWQAVAQGVRGGVPYTICCENQDTLRGWTPEFQFELLKSVKK